MKDERLYLVHMVETAQRVRAKVKNLTRQQFDANEDLQLAVTHLLQIIGESARRVPQQARETIAAIPWPSVVGMRHRIVHDYLDVDYNIVWKVATEEMTPLIAALTAVIDPRLFESDAELDV